MNNNKDPMDQMIVDELLKEAASIDEEIEKAGVESMPAGLKDKIKENIYRQMEERERERIYAKLSEEDRKALELGREMLKKSKSLESEGNLSKEVPEPSTDEDGKVVRYRRRRKVYVAVAAVAVLVLAMGITSVGGAERVIEMVKSMVGEREVIQVETGEDNYIVEIDKEEVAYQEIKDVFGVEAVKPIEWPKGTAFIESEIDKEMQIASLYYEYDDELMTYHISSHYTDSSWGIDVENEVTDIFFIELEKFKIEIREYKKPASKEKTYSAKFSYSGLDYFLIGTMEKADFEVLVKNLRFF